MAPSVFELQNDMNCQLERVRLEFSTAGPSVSRPVREVLRYIHEHLFDPGLNVSVARLECGLRDNNVSSLFRHELGCSIKEYIEILRMKAARRLLEDERFSIFEIGQSLGYEHPQTFYRVFRRRFGCAPATGRRAGY